MMATMCGIDLTTGGDSKVMKEQWAQVVTEEAISLTSKSPAPALVSASRPQPQIIRFTMSAAADDVYRRLLSAAPP